MSTSATYAVNLPLTNYIIGWYGTQTHDPARFLAPGVKAPGLLTTFKRYLRQDAFAASDTRRPCRNISSSKARSRASLRLFLVAAIRRSTSVCVRCLRSFIILSNVQARQWAAKPRESVVCFPHIGQKDSFCPMEQALKRSQASEATMFATLFYDFWLA